VEFRKPILGDKQGIVRTRILQINWERNVHTFVSGNERSLCGRFLPGNESAWERNVPVPFFTRACERGVSEENPLTAHIYFHNPRSPLRSRSLDFWHAPLRFALYSVTPREGDSDGQCSEAPPRGVRSQLSANFDMTLACLYVYEYRIK